MGVKEGEVGEEKERAAVCTGKAGGWARELEQTQAAFATGASSGEQKPLEL